MIARIAAALLSCALAGSLLTAQDKPAAKPAAESKAETYVLMKVGSDVQVVNKADVEAKKKALQTAFQAAKEKWLAAKKAAEAAKKTYDEQEPQPTTVEVMTEEYPNREAANAALAKMHVDNKHPADNAKTGKKAAEGAKKAEGGRGRGKGGN